MNKTDKQDLKLIEYRLDAQDESVKNLHLEFDEKLGNIHTDIKFIKENLFNPETGLWAETKLNTQHRQQTTKWRTRYGVGYVHKKNQKKSKKSLTFCISIIILVCNDNEKDIRKICDWERDCSFSNSP